MSHYAKSELEKSNLKLKKDATIARAFVTEVNARFMEKMEIIKSQELTIGNLKMELDICEKKNEDVLQQIDRTDTQSFEDGFRRDVPDKGNMLRDLTLSSIAPQ